MLRVELERLLEDAAVSLRMSWGGVSLFFLLCLLCLLCFLENMGSEGLSRVVGSFICFLIKSGGRVNKVGILRKD